MARAGMGEPFVMTHPDQASAKAAEFRQLIETPVLTGIQVQYKNFDAYALDPAHIPDVFAERPVIVVGKWRGAPKGEIEVSGAQGGRTYRQTFNVAEFNPSTAHAALRYLWARNRIARLDDDNHLAPDDARTQEVTDLGLKYSLLTAYTSFVAVDSEVRLKEGQATTVKQPLPLPQGVPNTAVGQLGQPMRAVMAVPPPAAAPEAESRMFKRAMPVLEALTLGADVLFGFGKVTLMPAGRARLDKLVADLRRINSSYSIQIVGHADSTEANPQRLGQRRAEAVARYLMAKGIPAARITTQSKGQTDPVAPNTLPSGEDNPTGRALNRRVTLTVIAR